MIFTHKRALVQAVLLCGTALAVPAYAADADTAPKATADNNEILVTAQRRSENLKDVPMAIAALSGDQLTKAGIGTTADLAKAAPSVVIAQYGGFMQPSIRGISSAGANIGDNSNVALYIDGIYQPQQIGTLIALPDVEQVEILKGPQGALYGQNATGGAILVNTMAPASTLTGKFSASYGNYNDVNLRGYVSGPITDTLSASFSGGFQQRDGFRAHVITGQRDFGLDSQVYRAKLKYQPSAGISLTLTGYLSWHKDSAPYAGFALNNNTHANALLAGLSPAANPNGYVTAPVATDPSQFSTDPGVFTSTRSKGVSLAGKFDVGAGTITALSAYSRNKSFYVADADFSPVSYAQASMLPEAPLTSSYFTQELNFASNKMGALSFIAGGFFLTGNEEFGSNTFQIAHATTVLPAAPSVFDLAINNYGRVDKRIFALYADVTLTPTDQLTLTAGGRYTSERQRGFSGPYGGTISEYSKDPVNFNKFTPRVTARYAITPDANIYASWGKGFKSGVINTSNLAQDPVNPENITSYEVGFKGHFFDALTFDLAAFHYDYTDLQIVAYAPPVYINQNAASARINGVEANASLAVTPNFKLTGSVGFLDAKFTSFPAAAVFGWYAPAQVNLQSTQNLAGTPMPRAPKFTGSFAFDYKTHASVGDFGLHAGVYHNSGSNFDVSGVIRQDSYTTVDAELSYEPKEIAGLRMVLWAKNIGNEAYLATFLDSQLANGVTYAEPRTYGIRAEFKY